jgi:uncharacterized membrane protein YccF (DUF307 family)
MKTVLLLYGMGNFAGMLWTGSHSLFTIVSFWVALALFYALASWSQSKRHVRKYQRTILRREMRQR